VEPRETVGCPPFGQLPHLPCSTAAQVCSLANRLCRRAACLTALTLKPGLVPNQDLPALRDVAAPGPVHALLSTHAHLCHYAFLC
jgi:hypothetical protein